MLAYVNSSCYMLRRAVGLGLALASAHASPNAIRPHRCAATVTSSRSRGRLQQCWLGPPGFNTRYRPYHDGVYDVRGKQSETSRVLSGASTGLEMTSQPSDVESAAAAATAVVPVVPVVVAGDTSKATARNVLAKARKDARFDEEGEYRVHQELLEGKTTRFVSRVMYDGTNYRGFQLQNNGQPTVQGVLEHALSQRFQKYVPVVAAGRTDTGVHAMGQAVHFDLPNADEDLAQLVYSMNQMLPADVRVWNMTATPPCSAWQAERGLPWSSMLNALGKVYSYRLFVGEIPSPLDRLYRVHANHAARAPIDVERLTRAMELFVGEHDFAGFSNEMDKRTALRKADGFTEFNTRRTVYSADVVDEGGGNLRLVFHLDGALYRMVRNMVGTLLAIAAGRVELDVIEEIFRTGVRDSRRIYAAPAHGLTLETVHYDGYG